MRLLAAARRFDKTGFYDGVSLVPAFYGQLLLFDEAKRDATSSSRRIISTAADSTIPPSRLVTDGLAWYILGDMKPDVHNGVPLRVAYIAHEAPIAVSISSLSGSLNSTGLWSTRMGATWVKNQAFTEQSSRLAQTFELYFTSFDPLYPNLIVNDGTQMWLTKTSHVGDSGIQVVNAELLGNTSDVVQAVSVTSPSDPITEAPGTDTTVTCLMLRWQALFAYGSKDAPTYGPEDVQIIVKQADVTTPVGSTVTMGVSKFKVASAQRLDGVFLCRATKIL